MVDNLFIVPFQQTAWSLFYAMAMFVWGTLRGRLDFHVEEVPVRIRGLARALDGYTIIQVSDVHTGIFVRATTEITARQLTTNLINFITRLCQLRFHDLW